MDIENAMKSPGAVFGTPDVLEASTELTAEQKRAILLQWKDKLQQLQAADDEGMHGTESTASATAECLRHVTNALSRLTAERDQAGKRA